MHCKANETEQMINLNREIEAVVFDWAGTTVDYGCQAPMSVFAEIFKEKDIIVTLR